MVTISNPGACESASGDFSSDPTFAIFFLGGGAGLFLLQGTVWIARECKGAALFFSHFVAVVSQTPLSSSKHSRVYLKRGLRRLEI